MPYINHDELAQLEAGFSTDENTPDVSWHSIGRSHPGRVRELNEDAFLNYTEHKLWAVADGMGGLSRGDYASKVVVEALVHFIKQKDLPSTIVDLESRLRGAHEVCRNSFRGERVGATVAALYCYGPYCFFLWAGDSRIYRMRGDELKQMTSDHTVAQEKCARGELSPMQALLHPSAHVLTRAVGVHQTLHLDLLYDTFQPGDRYLVCSDGLYNDLAEGDLQQYLSLGSIEEALDGLTDRALDRGGRDNLSAIILEAAAT